MRSNGLPSTVIGMLCGGLEAMAKRNEDKAKVDGERFWELGEDDGGFYLELEILQRDDIEPEGNPEEEGCNL